MLLALVDLELNRRVVQIASVSGGSITNAFIALRCAFQQVSRQLFKEVARELVGVIVRHGILTKWVIRAPS